MAATQLAPTKLTELLKKLAYSVDNKPEWSLCVENNDATELANAQQVVVIESSNAENISNAANASDLLTLLQEQRSYAAAASLLETRDDADSSAWPQQQRQALAYIAVVLLFYSVKSTILFYLLMVETVSAPENPLTILP